MLIYINGERRVEKSRIIKAIEIKFALFGEKNKLVIFAPTRSARNGISRSNVYTTLRVNNWTGKM